MFPIFPAGQNYKKFVFLESSTALIWFAWAKSCLAGVYHVLCLCRTSEQGNQSKDDLTSAKTEWLLLRFCKDCFFFQKIHSAWCRNGIRRLDYPFFFLSASLSVIMFGVFSFWAGSLNQSCLSRTMLVCHFFFLVGLVLPPSGVAC